MVSISLIKVLMKPAARALSHLLPGRCWYRFKFQVLDGSFDRFLAWTMFTIGSWVLPSPLTNEIVDVISTLLATGLGRLIGVPEGENHQADDVNVLNIDLELSRSTDSDDIRIQFHARFLDGAYSYSLDLSQWLETSTPSWIRRRYTRLLTWFRSIVRRHCAHRK